MGMRQRLKELEELRRKSELGGGPERLAAQHARGKLSARERLDLLLDEGSFIELDRFVTSRTTGFGSNDQRFLGDGVDRKSTRLNSSHVANSYALFIL